MNSHILFANEKYKNKEYDLASEHYILGIKELKLIKPRKAKVNEAITTALCSLTMCQAVIAFNIISSNLPCSLTNVEKKINRNLVKAEEFSSKSSGEHKTKMENKISTTRDIAFNFLRNAYWNKLDSLSKLAQDGTNDGEITVKKNQYNRIIKHLNHYIDLTNKISETVADDKKSDCYTAQTYIAEVYDWLSDLYFDSMKSVNPLPEAIEEASDYNQKAVTLWGTINPEKDISILHLGYLNIQHHGYIQTKNQNYLNKMSDYIKKHLNATVDDANVMLEITGHKLMVAIHQTPINSTLATTLAGKFNSLDPSQLNPEFLFYYDLAKTFLKKNPTPVISTPPADLHRLEFFAQKSKPSPLVTNKKRTHQIEPFETKEEYTKELEEYQSEDEDLNSRITANKNLKLIAAPPFKGKLSDVIASLSSDKAHMYDADNYHAKKRIRSSLKQQELTPTEALFLIQNASDISDNNTSSSPLSVMSTLAGFLKPNRFFPIEPSLEEQTSQTSDEDSSMQGLYNQ